MFVTMTVVLLLLCLCLAFSAGVLGGATPTITATGQLRKREEVTHSQLKEELRDVERKLRNALQKQCPARVPQIDELREKLLTMEAGLQATQAALKSLMQSTSRQNATAASSTFIRWGRNTCTINSHLVYSGVAGGSWYNDIGAAANHLCLTETPEFDNEPIPSYYSTLYGAEYEHIGSHHNHDVLCSVCRAPQSTTIMVPATHTCPPGLDDPVHGAPGCRVL